MEKHTDAPRGFRRRYADACAAAHALELVGDRWALLVVRELMIGPKRFTDLRAGLPGVSAAVLTQRLEELEAAGVLRRRALPPPAASRVYELTEWGREAEPIFQALGRWAARSPFHDPSLAFSEASLVLSLRTMFAADRAEGIGAPVALDLGAGVWVARLSRDGLSLERGEAAEAGALLRGDPRSVAAAIYGGADLAELEAAGALAVEGDRALILRAFDCFPLPPKAPAA